MALFVRRRWPKVAAAVIALALLVGVAIVALGADSSPSGPSASPSPSESPPTGGLVNDPPPVAFARVVTAPDAALKGFAEQRVTARTVRVLRRVGPSVAWVGSNDADKLLLVLVNSDAPFAFANGVGITFEGRVRAAAPGFGRTLGLTSAELADFERQGAYVEIEAYQLGA